ncbi:MAG: hypothetical protein V4653_14145 [Pseudomonadota bacterium]
MIHHPASTIAQSLSAATYAGYRAGFEAAREEAAVQAERAGQVPLAQSIRSMRPLPDYAERVA